MLLAVRMSDLACTVAPSFTLRVTNDAHVNARSTPTRQRGNHGSLTASMSDSECTVAPSFTLRVTNVVQWPLAKQWQPDASARKQRIIDRIDER
jgi:hypothetical protein